MISIEQIKQLREETGVSVSEVKKALEQSAGDPVKAKEILRTWGKTVLNKKLSRETKSGLIEAYVHQNAKTGVLLDIRCETDFVANSPEFKNLAHEICLQIAAMKPLFISETDIPEEILAKETEIYAAQMKDAKKPENVAKQILEGKLNKYKQEFYSAGGDREWCKYELENLQKQRKEFEKSMNDEFLRWFFEKYMANSAEDWEGHISGIYELYWKDVELSREMARTMECSEINNMPEFNMINIKYESEYGKVEFWEEMKNVKMPEFGNREMNVVSPYMKVWIFPPKEFIKYEMKKAMKEHEFPGSGDEKVERTNEGGPTEEEKEHIKQDRGLMGLIKGMSEKYNGNVDVSVQFKDYNTSETVFNIYVQINENDIIKMKPMLLEEMPEQDVNIEIDFEKVYELISESEKEMGGERIESPPWDKKFSPMGKVKEIKNGVEMYFKVKGIINSATITPESSEKDAKKLINEFFSMMMKEGMNGDKQEDNQGQEGQGKSNSDVNDNKDSKGLTGNVILEGYQPF